MTPDRARGCLAAVLVSAVAWALIISAAAALWNDSEPEPSRTPSAAVTTPDEVKVTPSPRPTRASRSERVTVPERTSGQTARIVCRIGPPPRGAAQRYAFPKVPPCQRPCLRELWDRESGWSATADNPRSSAYGIPQILGLERRTGDDYRAQVRAGLDYIKHRYGTPCRALAAHDLKGWY